MSYRPPSGPAKHESDGPSSVPFAVQLLGFLAGAVILMLAGKSVLQDWRLAHKLTHLDALYEAVPATWVKVAVRRDASGDAEFYPDVLFDYHVGGKSVWGWRFSLEETPHDSAYWAERLASYAVGDTVTAFVNPKDPKDSFVEKKTEGTTYRIRLRAFMGLAFCLFGGTLVVLALSGWLRNSSPKKKGKR